MSWPLPTPAEAMRAAVEAAQRGDVEGGSLWLGIARELRVGAMSRPRPRPLDELPAGVVPRVTHFGDDYLLPICEQVAGDDPEGCLVSFNVPHVTCLACLRIVKEREVASSEVAGSEVATPVARHAEYEAGLGDYAGETAAARFERIAVPAVEPAYRAADTAIIDTGFELPLCAYCEHSLVWVTPGPEAAPERTPHWAHALTNQSVCPVSAPDQAHTFATPRGDARG